ncbi:helix-turn-helix transcriptional regulator [Streptomyces sp. SID3343]|uniref:helix-turn-helix domain-containing protein n=1 Tax=Streptomyces sp. SID3343 TaxID=2690260 RepID=UPI00136FCDBB|nr:helix-turn-helix transcriptional regulator [Streptomyces sp. SID3343]MYV98533.1 helix-turn-helix domain-containing protein [Streptomyces sp. SID3343]
MPATPTYARRRIGNELRKLRRQQGLSLDMVSDAIDWNKSKLSRIETAKMPISRHDLHLIASMYSIDRDALARLEDWIRQDTGGRRWWNEYADLITSAYEEFISLEAHAAGISTAHSSLIPGLLQSEGYARAVITCGPFVPDPDTADALTEIRMKRQEIITSRAAVKVSAVITESVLHNEYGGRNVMQAQLRHLLDMTRLSNVDLRLIQHASMQGVLVGAFTILTFPDARDPNMVFIEHQGGIVSKDSDRDVKRYRRYLDHLSTAAMNQTGTRELIAKRLDES